MIIIHMEILAYNLFKFYCKNVQNAGKIKTICLLHSNAKPFDFIDILIGTKMISQN